MTASLGRRHAITVRRETKHPYQWIGLCSCGRGIRCNSSDDAWAFFLREGCTWGVEW